MIPCPLCSNESCEFFFRDKFREYLQCDRCRLIFVTPEFYVSEESEKARYEEHNNDPEDPRYRAFLERIVPSIEERFEAGCAGIDFGSGPTPLLAQILREKGYRMEIYDPFYAPDESVLKREYDFVVSTEVIEHVKEPLAVFEKLLSMLRPSGVVAIMTRPYDDSVDFKTWHYKNDRTHICFFSVESFDWIAERLGLRYFSTESDIFVFEKR